MSKHVIVGTAGHIDHGKTALVEALTGVNADRWEEERRRGITIDLGFADLDLDANLRLGFIDVPGHERFVRNMLAGASGIDIVLLVIAADESIMPQTREHFDICRLLGVRRGVIALTKSDLAEPDLIELVRMETHDYVAGSFLEDAPVVPVSARTGAGMDDLRAALSQAALVVPAKSARNRFRLPIDRSFVIKGFGAVVTGTLVSGAVSLEDEVEIHPSGRRARVRGLQRHGERVERAEAGSRTAVNLSGIDAADLARGMTLTEPDVFEPSLDLDCELDLLPSAPALKHGSPVHFHLGAAELEGKVLLLERNPDTNQRLRSLAPGGRAFVRVRLTAPALAVAGDRFVIRRFSPVTTIGGGRPRPPSAAPGALCRARRTPARVRLRRSHKDPRSSRLERPLPTRCRRCRPPDRRPRSGYPQSRRPTHRRPRQAPGPGASGPNRRCVGKAPRGPPSLPQGQPAARGQAPRRRP
jgi:selenocysteine-specific elongation factor